MNYFFLCFPMAGSLSFVRQEWRRFKEGGIISLKYRCGEGRGGRKGLGKGMIMGYFACHLGRLFSSDVYIYILRGGDGSARVKILRFRLRAFA